MSLLKPALLCLCLCGLAVAQPVRFEDEQTGFIWITDKQAGEQVIMSSQSLIHLNANGRNWQIEIPEDDGWFSSALWGDDGVYLSVRQGKISGNVLIRKYSKAGKLLWEHDTEYGPSGNLDQIYSTPPRERCGSYKPSIDEMWDMQAGQFKSESYRDYLSDDVRGEYIYAHRADECGKFTYKFHWTDPTNPAPQILEGWQ